MLVWGGGEAVCVLWYYLSLWKADCFLRIAEYRSRLTNG